MNRGALSRHSVHTRFGILGTDRGPATFEFSIDAVRLY